MSPGSLQWQRERDVAIGIVRDAALLACTIELEMNRTAFVKPDQSPVTIADLAVQVVISTQLAAAFPDDPLVAEEDSASLREPQAQPLLENVLRFVRRHVPDADSEQVLSAIGRHHGAFSASLEIPDEATARPGFRDKIWDQAAGSIIIEEAGGRVTDLHGAALDFGTGRFLEQNEGVVASNGVLHAAALAAIDQRD